MPIDPAEEAGLRAFALSVITDDDGLRWMPIAIERGGTRVDVVRVEAEWQEEERAGYRVKLADGSSWLLYYVPELDLWSGIADSGAVGGA